MKKILEIQNLKVSYGPVQALRGISLDVGEKEIVTLLGSNGAGKSSLLRSVMGMTSQRSGRILYEGREIQQWPTEQIVRSGIALVPEGRGILATLTVLENLELGAYHRHGWKDELDEIFKLFPVLKERVRQNAGTLSGGEQQMLAIGRALLSKPRLLMLDEPSLGLAPKIIQNIFALIERIRDTGVSILLIEQNAHMGLKVADRVYCLQNGEICLSGTAEEVRAQEDATQKAYLGG